MPVSDERLAEFARDPFICGEDEVAEVKDMARELARYRAAARATEGMEKTNV